jgi:hypothetical protein
MKISRRQIQKIIREEGSGINIARAFGTIEDRRDEEEAVLDPEIDAETVVDAWAGGDNLVDPIDQAEASGAEPATTEQEIEEIVERLSRKLRIKRILKEVDWVDPMAYLEDSEAVEKAFASGNRISLMIDQPGLVGEFEPPADDEEEAELVERMIRRLRSKKKLAEEKESRVMFDPESVDLPIPKPLQRLLSPDISPQKFAAFDEEMDASGTPQHQAFALAAFAMTYADEDGSDPKAAGAQDILKKALQMLPKIMAGMKKAKEKGEGGGEEEAPPEEEKK